MSRLVFQPPQCQHSGEFSPTSPRRLQRRGTAFPFGRGAMPPRNSGEKWSSSGAPTPSQSRPCTVSARLIAQMPPVSCPFMTFTLVRALGAPSPAPTCGFASSSTLLATLPARIRRADSSLSHALAALRCPDGSGWKRHRTKAEYLSLGYPLSTRPCTSSHSTVCDARCMGKRPTSQALDDAVEVARSQRLEQRPSDFGVGVDVGDAERRIGAVPHDRLDLAVAHV